jgi:hypothetical protein
MTRSHNDLGRVLHFMRAAMRDRRREIQSGRGTADIQYGGLIEPTLLKMGQAQNRPTAERRSLRFIGFDSRN